MKDPTTEGIKVLIIQIYFRVMSTMQIRVKIKIHQPLINLPVLHQSIVEISVKKLKNSNFLRVLTNDFIQSYNIYLYL